MMNEIVAQAKNKKNFTVVSDDRKIQYAVRAQGAKILSVKDFLIQGEDRKGTSASQDRISQESDPKRISKELEYKITSEMQNVWLKKNKD